MSRAMFALVLVLVGPFGQAADIGPSSAPMKAKFESIIQHQLEAFRRNDYRAAYSYAASAIRSQFPLEAFERMVRHGYPVIAGSTAASFGLSLDDGEHATVTVRVHAGELVGSFQYELELDSGEWRITGVRELDDQTTVI